MYSSTRSTFLCFGTFHAPPYCQEWSSWGCSHSLLCCWWPLPAFYAEKVAQSKDNCKSHSTSRCVRIYSIAPCPRLLCWFWTPSDCGYRWADPWTIRASYEEGSNYSPSGGWLSSSSIWSRISSLLVSGQVDSSGWSASRTCLDLISTEFNWWTCLSSFRKYWNLSCCCYGTSALRREDLTVCVSASPWVWLCLLPWQRSAIVMSYSRR